MVYCLAAGLRGAVKLHEGMDRAFIVDHIRRNAGGPQGFAIGNALVTQGVMAADDDFRRGQAGDPKIS